MHASTEHFQRLQKLHTTQIVSIDQTAAHRALLFMSSA